MQRVLIIEDDENNMELITFILERHGYVTLRATTAGRGLEMLKEERPDFVLLDIQLPDINGYEVLQHIRESEIGTDLPVIAVTSFAMTGDRQRLLNAGCNGYLEKPIDPFRIIEQIRSVLEGRT
jgi:two-component system, cell cycle response regulator DivK